MFKFIFRTTNTSWDEANFSSFLTGTITMYVIRTMSPLSKAVIFINMMRRSSQAAALFWVHNKILHTEKGPFVKIEW